MMGKMMDKIRIERITLVLCAALSLSTIDAHGLSLHKKQLSARVDLHSRTTTPFVNDVLLKCFGSSHAATALRSDWQAQLTKVRSEIGTEYVRFHGLLDDDMSVVLKSKRHRVENEYFRMAAAANQTCSFVADQDLSDPAGPVVNASTKEECCAACYNTPTGLPTPCIAAVWTPDGKCYTKLNDAQPYKKNNTGVVTCVTDRKPPKGFMYSWVNIFRVFDFLVSIGMRPVVEISFMPSLLASDPTMTGFWYKGGHSAPRDFSEWRDFIQSLATALVDRYGLEEVQEWYFETWNEPNCGFYDTAPCCGPTCGNQTAYLELYTNTYKAIKAAEPTLRVGGPATAQLGWVEEFLEDAVDAGCKPDFISTHLYPTDPYIDHGREGFADAVQAAAENISTTAAKLKIDAPPMLLTEFNCGLGIDCADAPYAASFVAHQAIRAQNTTRSIAMESYWTFSDIFEEQGQQPWEFSQAFGAQSINGVPKPVYRGMQLIRRLLNNSIPVQFSTSYNASAIDVVVTNDGVENVEGLVLNHPGGPPKSDLATKTPIEMNNAQIKGEYDIKLDEDAVNVTIVFTGQPPAEVMARCVDATRANALPLYVEMGSPAYPNATELAALQAASEIQSEQLPVTVSKDSWSISLFMGSYSVCTFSFIQP